MATKTTRHMKLPPKTDTSWRDNLKSFSVKVGFHLSLSKSMLEFLCAVADDVQWDRNLYHRDICVPENWIASEVSLTKRGLIQRKSDKYFEDIKHDNTIPFAMRSCCELTPAGRCVVDLLKMAGVFVEADAAIIKKSKRA